MIASDCDNTVPVVVESRNQALRIEREIVGGAMLVLREDPWGSIRTATPLRFSAMRTRNAAELRKNV